MFKFKGKLKNNFAGVRQSNLKNQARKHRLQGALTTIIIIAAFIIAAGYFLLPEVEAGLRAGIEKEIEDEMITVPFSAREIELREHVTDNVVYKKMKKENVPEDVLVLSDVPSNYIFKRSLSGNQVITAKDVIAVNELIPDSRRYQEYNSIIEIPTGLEEYRGDEQSDPIVVDVRYLNLDDDRNEVVLSKKELPLLIGSTLWFEIEDERERRLMDSAIKEKELIGGSLILTMYTDPVIQKEAEVTYIPLEERGKENEMTSESEVGENEEPLEQTN